MVRQAFWPVVWLLLLMIIGTIIGHSRSYTACIHEQKNLAEYNHFRQKADTFGEISERKFLRLKLQGTCASQFAESNEHAISALSAVALAIFTFYLWHSTRGLRRYAEVQARDMSRLVRLARANALAGMRAARAARNSANAAMTQANIAERSFFDLERPYLFVDGFQGHVQRTHTALPQGSAANPNVHTITQVGNIQHVNLPDYFNARYTIKNWGRTPAIIYEKQFYSIFADALPSEVHYKEPIERGERIVGPGELTEPFGLETYHFKRGLEEQQDFINGTEKHVMFIFGFIRYKDVFGNKYIRGQAVRYLEGENSFVVEGGDTYNYEHKED